MRRHSAAPEGKLGGNPRGGLNNGDGCSIADLQLPAVIVERLKAEGVHTASDWVRLGPKRKQLFGVVASMVARIDIAVTLAKRFGRVGLGGTK
jgi:hypothetical protein